MSRLKDLMQTAPLHERRIEVRSHALENGEFIFEGRLRDERFVTFHRLDGQLEQPRIFHNMSLRLRVGGWPLTILEAEAEIEAAPHHLCPTITDTVQKIIGLKFTGGFTDEAKRRLGGLEGCAHLTHLLTVIAPAAIQGFWAKASQKQAVKPPARFEDIPGIRHALNSCLLWAEDGPIVREIKQRIESQHKAEIESIDPV